MSDLSAHLALPYLAPSQAQKHVTHNEALQILDAVVQLGVRDRDQALPPAAPATGDRHIVPAGASGVWSGQDNHVALWTGVAWTFLAPRAGWRAWVEAEEAEVTWHGGAWAEVRALDNLDMLGVNTSADALNRLAVSSEATLLTHAGSGHQLKINKSATADTASLLFQSDWSGRAEMGLAGDDGWSIKVSPDGSTWTKALALDPTTGHASGTAVQAAPDDTTPGRLMRADYGFGPGNVLGTVTQAGGQPTGALIERGSNANGTYLRFADGTQICTTEITGVDVTNAVGGFYKSGNLTWNFPAVFSENSWTGGGRIKDSSSGIAVHVTGGGVTSPSAITAYCTTSPVNRTLCLFAIGLWF
ncbi:MAG: DUF2793 domain-containing protein [Pseudomonadota bacterium]